MVVVVMEQEQEQEQSQEETTPQNLPKPNASTSNTTLHSPSQPPPPTENSNGGGTDSDGFETASEREVSDDEETNATTEHHKEAAAAGEAKCQDSLNDDASKQETLARANDAKLEGNKLFGEGKYEEALLQYETALHIVPEMPSSVDLHSICYANRAVCFMKLVFSFSVSLMNIFTE
uniref:Heat shock protein 70 n=1 Tax=Rhizophora mucronata TaxID=61149 RepID=A0A2P2JTZ4_RHIMU